MTAYETEKALATMRILVDTREQPTEQSRARYAAFGCPYERRKLDFGDYMNEYVPGLAIDRKASLDELAMNLCSSDSSRFWREIRGAKRAGIHMIVLIEDRRYHCPSDVINWRSKWSNVTGAKLFEAMFAISNAYGVEFQFCKRSQVGQRIVEILRTKMKGR